MIKAFSNLGTENLFLIVMKGKYNSQKSIGQGNAN